MSESAADLPDNNLMGPEPKDAIEDLRPSNGSAVINPVRLHANHSDPKDVEFDVAVTVSNMKESGGKAGLRIAAVEIGGGAGKKPKPGR